MSEPSKSRWVVLLQKAPRGPLSRDEVRALIDQGLLRMNDLAMEIPEAPVPGAKTDWKLLWQYPEFNRRTGERRKTDDAPKATPTPEGEQRQKTDRRGPELSPEEQKRRILENLPADIAAIDPSDLALRSAKAVVRPPEDEPRLSPPENNGSPAEAPRWGLLVSIAGGAVAVVLAFGLLATRTPPAREASRAAASEAPPPAASARDSRAAVSRAERMLIRSARRTPSAGLPTGGELRPFDANALRKREAPAPAVSPVARDPEDSADSEFVAPVRRPRMVRPGAPIPSERIAEDGEDEETVRSQNRRLPPRLNRMSGSEYDDGDAAEPEEAPADAEDY